MKSIKSFTLSPESIRSLEQRSVEQGKSQSSILDEIIQQQVFKSFVEDLRRQLNEICPDREVAPNGQE